MVASMAISHSHFNHNPISFVGVKLVGCYRRAQAYRGVIPPMLALSTVGLATQIL